MAIDFKKHQYAISSAAVALGALLLILKVIIGPLHGKLTTVAKQVLLQESKLKKGLVLIENRETINHEYGKYASYFSLQSYSNEEAVAGFLKELEKISRDSGFLILDIKPQKEAEADAISKQFQINIKAEANMKTMVSFLYGLYTSPLLFSVEKIVLVPKSEGSSELSVNLTLMGVLFM
ncbi:MAG: hypothetical protein PHH75_08325 [Candidatus Omnitrophica bacterium]|nr:hypothetical protein [Candidatus Omnitrophota bacterium]